MLDTLTPIISMRHCHATPLYDAAAFDIVSRHIFTPLSLYAMLSLLRRRCLRLPLTLPHASLMPPDAMRRAPARHADIYAFACAAAIFIFAIICTTCLRHLRHNIYAAAIDYCLTYLFRRHYMLYDYLFTYADY